MPAFFVCTRIGEYGRKWRISAVCRLYKNVSIDIKAIVKTVGLERSKIKCLGCEQKEGEESVWETAG